MSEHTPDPGERGPQGERGERGPKGDPGESALNALAEEQVARLIKARSVSKWLVYSQGIVIAVLAAVLLVLGVWVLPGLHNDSVTAAQNARTAAHRECLDLKMLAAVPVIKPSSPSDYAAQEAYEYHTVLVALEHKEDCPANP